MNEDDDLNGTEFGLRLTRNAEKACAMSTTPEEFASLLAAPEGSRIEFKSAINNYHFEKLLEYCVALANERGGKIVLGVTDRRPVRS